MGEKLDSYIDDQGQTVRDGDIVLIDNKKWKVQYISHHYVNLSAFPDGGRVHHPFCCSKPSKFLGEDMKPWKDMSREEKGALLLASHEGKTLQYWKRGTGGWADCLSVAIYEHEYYRVKPEPVVKGVVMYAGTVERLHARHPISCSWVADEYDTPAVTDTHKITFNLVDGEPDCSSVKMEKLK